MQSASSANAIQAALLQAAAAAAAASQFPYNIKQYLEDPRNFSQFYNPFTSLQSIGNTSSSSPLQFQNENSNIWSRPLESLYAAAIAAASTTNTTTANNQTTANSNSNSNTTPLPPLNQSSINNQFNLLSNAGVNMNLNNSFFLNQLAAASSSSSNLNNLMSSPNLSMDHLKPKMNLHEMTVQAAALAAAAQQQQQQQQQFLYHPYSNQIQQYHLQQNQQTK